MMFFYALKAMNRRMRIFFGLIALVFCTFSDLHALEWETQLRWGSPVYLSYPGAPGFSLPTFEGAEFIDRFGGLPGKVDLVAVQSSTATFNARMDVLASEALTREEQDMIAGRTPSSGFGLPEVRVRSDRGKVLAQVTVMPWIQVGGVWHKVLRYRIRLTPQFSASRSVSSPGNAPATQSVLASGKWYKIGVVKDGVYKLTPQNLAALGMNVAEINPVNLRVYGNGGGNLPFSNAIPAPDDLIENPIWMRGAEDGRFDSTDVCYFFGKGPHRWNATTGACAPFRHQLHLYSDTTYYFITADLGPGQRISGISPPSLQPNVLASGFDERLYYENEAVNLIHSGRDWYGEKFDAQTRFDFPFTIPDVQTNEPARVFAVALSRSNPASTFLLSCGNGSGSFSPRVFDPARYYAEYGWPDSTCFSFQPSGSNLNVAVEFQKNPAYSAALGYLDFVELHARRALRLFGNQLLFRDTRTVGSGNVVQFSLSGTGPQTRIWDVTNPTAPQEMSVVQTGSSSVQFSASADQLREYMAFDPFSSAVQDPELFGSVSNQNLHATPPVDLIMVVHPLFWEQGQRLKKLHEDQDGMRVAMVTPQQIYNEFSSGAQDLAAIRQYVKMLYWRAAQSKDRPRYLLLMGDASYNNRVRDVSTNTNFIACYQSKLSLALTTSFVSDDFFGFMDSTEGESNEDLMDVGIGRLIVKTREEAANVVDKIIDYETRRPVLLNTDVNVCSEAATNENGDWKNMVCFVADDQDGGIHMRDADDVATYVDTTYHNYNIDKIYLDAYKQVTNAGGQRYPEVNKAITARVERGALLLNYTGHGGETGWALERILEVSDIKSWKNPGRYPFFVTATCEFSRFDDPLLTSAGEDVLLQPKGGGIGLLTTTRLVYSSPNKTLNMNFYRRVFTSDTINGGYYRLGDVARMAKNLSANPGSSNHRNFSLLGDPAMELNYPRYRVVTTSVKVVPNSLSGDTVKALSKVEVKGFVANDSGQRLSNFNGVVFPSVYDKQMIVKTLANDSTGNDRSPVIPFRIRKNIVYKGKASVTNGEFTFSFIVPKDISFSYGPGRISYYADNGNVDANGYYEQFIIGGVNLDAPKDNQGPEVRLYMNDEKFLSGSITDENPKLVARVRDDNGINTLGTGIGHDIMAVLDNKSEQSILLNDYYQADLNSYQSGLVRYGFTNLSEGPHELSFKVWDVYNNSSQSKIDFVVSKSAKLALQHVFNYPNPFTTNTRFFFEHNKPCESLQVQVQIFSVSGKLVKTLETTLQCEGYRSDRLEWDGLDDFGDRIGRGVYVYRLRVLAGDGSAAEKYEKLVLLQ